VHGVGGTLIQHLKEHLLHVDIHAGDRLFYYTTCGWMMWNWLVSGLASGAQLLLYDGSPLYPRADSLFDLIDEYQINIFGVSAKYIDVLKKSAVKPKNTHDLSSLRTILSTGSPLLPEGFDFVYESIKSDVCLSSISGGTDIISCFVLGCPILPVRRGEIQCRGLAMDVDVYDDNGQALRGEKGELVCKTPFPSMPVGFWNDPDQNKYHAAYFEKYPGVWWHGDYVALTENGGIIIYGRSDAVINPGGIRIGTAEIYRQVEQVDEVLESLVVGQDIDGDCRIILFVILRSGIALSDQLKMKIKQQLRQNASPHHVPTEIIQVTDIPRTKNGKIAELAVRNIIHGRVVKNQHALANPETLEQFLQIKELIKVEMNF
jgi:acetoacetyl-CoA synthetase